MTLADLSRQAWAGVSGHRLRATLSALGIIVGIGAVIASLAIAEGARRAALADIDVLGIDNVYVRATSVSDDRRHHAVAPELTRADAAAIAASAVGIDFVDTVRSSRIEMRIAANAATATLAGVGVRWPELGRLRIGHGRWLTAEDERTARRAAVLGARLASRLAPGAEAVGRSVSSGGSIFLVVGVLEERSTRPSASSLASFDANDTMFVPVTAMDVALGDHDAPDRVSEIAARTNSDLDGVTTQLTSLLARRHPDAVKPYEIVVPRDLLTARVRAQRTFDAMLLATGIIALLIAGTGIMNIMLASVAERRQEIGVRRSVGARQVDIIKQFALEAAMLCAAGGGFGIPVGAALAWTASLLAGWPVVVSLTSVTIALGVATSVGLAFGIYPACYAASVDPIEALQA